MNNTEQVISLLAGQGALAYKDTHSRLYLAHILQRLMAVEKWEVTIEHIFRDIPNIDTHVMLNTTQALLLAHNDWKQIFTALEKTKRRLEEIPFELEKFFHDVVIASMEAAVWLRNQDLLTVTSANQFFDFLATFLESNANSVHNRQLDTELSGRLSNLSPWICKMPEAGAFFKKVESGLFPRKCAQQILDELCLKRILGLCLREKIKICADYPK